MARRYKVSITETAEKDIKSIFEYISGDNPRAADKWISEIRSRINSLRELPMRCNIIPEAGEIGFDYRHIIYDNYRTIFKITGDMVFIMRVFHSSMLLDLKMFEK